MNLLVYAAQLKKFIEHYQCEDKVNEILRDSLVCVLSNLKWQQRLLSDDALTYDKILKLLLTIEAAERQARDLSGMKVVHVLHPQPRSHQTSPQY